MQTLASAAADGRVVTQADFARLVGRHASQVTRWIKAGKLSSGCLDSRKGQTFIKVREAVAELEINLDSGQQFAQSRPIIGSGTTDVSKPENVSFQGSLATEIQEEKLREIRNKNMRGEAETLAALGELVRVSAYNAEIRRQLAPLLSTFDELPMDLTDAVGQVMGDTSKAPDLLIMFRQKLLALRLRWVDLLSRSDIARLDASSDNSDAV
jgi:hypothetical protein